MCRWRASQLRNATAGVASYTQPGGRHRRCWGDGAAVRPRQPGRQDLAFVGNDYRQQLCQRRLHRDGTRRRRLGQRRLSTTLWEGSHIHDNGAPGSYLAHQLYLQAWGQVVQFNRVDDYNVKAAQAAPDLKSRGHAMDIVRYELHRRRTRRGTMDLVDVQDAPAYMSFQGMLPQGKVALTGADKAAYTGKDVVPGRICMAADAGGVSTRTAVYGNIYTSSICGATTPVHLLARPSSIGNEQARTGTLYWYNNTF